MQHITAELNAQLATIDSFADDYNYNDNDADHSGGGSGYGSTIVEEVILDWI